LIAENAEIFVRIAAIFVLTQETSDRIDVTCGQMLVSVNEILSSSEMTDTTGLHDRNCAAIAGTSGATRAISGKTVTIYDLIVVIVALMCATSTMIGIEHVTTRVPTATRRTGNSCLSYVSA
jgi:hypothetical protein